MTTPLVLDVGRATPSLNAWTGRPRYVYPALRAQWRRTISDAWFDAKARRDLAVSLWPLPPRERVALHVERYAPEPDALDHDNAYGGCKVLVDALKDLRLIRDDTPAALGPLTLEQRTSLGTPRRYWARLILTRAL